MTNVDGVESALDALEGQGARSFDATACDCVRTLLTRAEELGGAVGERLLSRAESHLQALAARYAKHRARVEAALSSVESAGHGEQHLLRKQLERGELTRVGRAVRRLAVQRPHPPRLSLHDGSLPAPEPVVHAGSQRMHLRKKRALVYEDSVADMVATFALARAIDVVPEDAGPYNALRIASEALDSMRTISPFYLTVQLNRLEELASLLTLPDLPKSQEPVALPRKKRSALKGGS